MCTNWPNYYIEIFEKGHGQLIISTQHFVCDRIQSHIGGFLSDMIGIRHDLHAHPELSNEEYRTSSIVVGFLEKWGYKVSRGIGKTGVVGTLHIGSSKKSIGIRADMDALPICEQTNLPYISKNKGIMHACGHDGHTTILLAAARYLAETKKFNGTVNLIFQPAEEGFAGAKAMINDGLFEKYPCDAIYGLHNWPGRSAGKLYFKTGPMMASVDTARITIEGHGGHGAMPENTIDPIVIGASVVMALQTIISRNVAPVDSALITIGSFHGGSASNIIPDFVKLELTIRTFSLEMKAFLKKRIRTLVTAQAESYGAKAVVIYENGYPPLVNSANETAYVQKIAEDVFGKDKIIVLSQPVIPSEDFSFMLEKCPGSYLFLGNGGSAELHNPRYVFNDEIIPIGASLWGALVEKYLH